MSEQVRDRLTGIVLLAVALVWSALVYTTIRTGAPGEVGPRAFPLFFGLALAVLSALLVARSFVVGSPDAEPREHVPAPFTLVELRVVLSTVGLIVVYAFVMEKISFLLATPLAVVAGFVLILGITRPVLVLGMAFGLTVGCYLIFGKLMGAYLPPGTWITFVL